jgi:hypothetical protein
MKMKQLAAAAAALALLGTSAAFAVSPGADSPTAEGQKGAAQHDQSAQPSQSTTAQPSQPTADQPVPSATDQPTQSATGESRDGSASTGASTAPAKGDQSFTQGESKRCATMTGADKEQCDKEEATKTEGPAAQDAAGGSQGSSK